MSDPFVSTFSAIHGGLSRNAEIAQRQPFADARELENRATRSMQDWSQANPAPGDEPSESAPGQGARPQGDEPLSRLIGSNLGAVSGQPQLQPGESSAYADRAPALLGDIRRQTGGTSRANWNDYLDRRYRAALNTGNTELMTKELAAIETTRQAGVARGVGLAMQALQAGDMQGYARGISIANQYIPDGFNNQIESGPNGQLTLVRTREGQEGGQAERIPLPSDPRQLANYTMMLMDPKWQQQHILANRQLDAAIQNQRAQQGFEGRRVTLAERADQREGVRFEGQQDAGVALSTLQEQQRQVRELEERARANPNDTDAQNQLAAARQVAETAQRAYDRAAGRAGPAAFATYEGINNNRGETARRDQIDRRQTGAVQARTELEQAEARHAREQSPESLAARDAARDRLARAEGGLNVGEFNTIRGTADRARNLDLREEMNEATIRVREARVALQNARNEAERTEASRRLDIAQQNADTARLRAMQQRTGLNPEAVRKIGEEAEGAISSIPGLDNAGRGGTSGGDIMRMYSADFAQANPNVPVSAIVRAMAPYLTGQQNISLEALRSGVLAGPGGRSVNLPPEFIREVTARTGRVDTERAARPQRQAAPPSEGAISRALPGSVTEFLRPNNNAAPPAFRDRRAVEQFIGEEPRQSRYGSHSPQGPGVQNRRGPTDDEIMRAIRQ